MGALIAGAICLLLAGVIHREVGGDSLVRVGALILAVAGIILVLLGLLDVADVHTA